MFTNIGSKLKFLAVFSAVLGIIGGVLIALLGGAYGLIYGIVIAIAAWVGSLSTYGIGVGVENSEAILRSLDDTRRMIKNVKTAVKDISEIEQDQHEKYIDHGNCIECRNCGFKQNRQNTKCIRCGEEFK